MIHQKVCCNCYEQKPILQFAKERRSLDGRRGRCRDCVRIDARAYYVANREAIVERQALRDRLKRVTMSDIP